MSKLKAACNTATLAYNADPGEDAAKSAELMEAVKTATAELTGAESKHATTLAAEKAMESAESEEFGQSPRSDPEIPGTRVPCAAGESRQHLRRPCMEHGIDQPAQSAKCRQAFGLAGNHEFPLRCCDLARPMLSGLP